MQRTTGNCRCRGRCYNDWVCPPYICSTSFLLSDQFACNELSRFETGKRLVESDDAGEIGDETLSQEVDILTRLIAPFAIEDEPEPAPEEPTGD